MPTPALSGLSTTMAFAAKCRRLYSSFFSNVLWNPASLLHTFLLGSIYVSLACSRTLLIKLSIRGKGIFSLFTFTL